MLFKLKFAFLSDLVQKWLKLSVSGPHIAADYRRWISVTVADQIWPELKSVLKNSRFLWSASKFLQMEKKVVHYKRGQDVSDKEKVIFFPLAHEKYVSENDRGAKRPYWAWLWGTERVRCICELEWKERLNTLLIIYWLIDWLILKWVFKWDLWGQLLMFGLVKYSIDYYLFCLYRSLFVLPVAQATQIMIYTDCCF